MLQVDLTRADCRNGGGATAERPLTGFLGGRVNNLPTPHTGRQIRPSHPAIIPHVEVPGKRKEVANRQALGLIKGFLGGFPSSLFNEKDYNRARGRFPRLCYNISS